MRRKMAKKRACGNAQQDGKLKAEHWTGSSAGKEDKAGKEAEAGKNLEAPRMAERKSRWSDLAPSEGDDEPKGVGQGQWGRRDGRNNPARRARPVST